MVASLLELAGLDWPVPDFSTLCRRQRTVAIQIPCRRSGSPFNLLADSTGVKMLGEGEWQVRRHGPSRRRQWRKVIWPWMRRLGTFGRWRSPPGARVTARCCRACWRRSRPASRSALSLPMALTIPARATRPSSGGVPLPSCRSARMVVPGRRIAPPQGQGTRPSEPPGVSAEPSGSAGPATTPGVDRGQEAMPQRLRRAHRLTRPRPPDRRDPHLHSPDEPLHRPRHRRNRTRRLNPKGKG